MDKLKELLQKSKPVAKIVQQKKVIQQHKQRFQQQQIQERKQEQVLQQKKAKQLQDFYQYDVRRKKVKPNEQQEQQINLTVDQAKAKLRTLHQPITLFGQTSTERYKRLLKIQAFYAQHPTFDMKAYDQQFQQRLKEQEEFNQLDAKYRDRMIEPQLGDDPQYLKKKREMIIAEKGELPFEKMCDEITLWVYKILRDWNRALEQKYNTEELREKGRESWARFEQSQSDMKSFMMVLKSRGGDKEMIRSVYNIINCCLVREYIQANDKYMDLSIGKAPWPLGIAMLSITVKRNAPKVSHVLNDELSRKWMQTIKRFITVSIEMYPSAQDFKRVGYSIRPTI